MAGAKSKAAEHTLLRERLLATEPRQRSPTVWSWSKRSDNLECPSAEGRPRDIPVGSEPVAQHRRHSSVVTLTAGSLARPLVPVPALTRGCGKISSCNLIKILTKHPGNPVQTDRKLPTARLFKRAERRRT
ncbi:hypothetical protein J6590_043267 [Homalodisca vitripennis]|nr:hypothetical protein J6590_043267 [Homalodisca vitripennis]